MDNQSDSVLDTNNNEIQNNIELPNNEGNAIQDTCISSVHIDLQCQDDASLRNVPYFSRKQVKTGKLKLDHASLCIGPEECVTPEENLQQLESLKLSPDH